ncbi:acyl-CoA synthetase [Kordiimonas marina]|uniref:acyl-CoA synthetase n=1 Tax=Kordiimonas marina TaxID=2872312 RepID=UPI001FF3028E|nr:long-chain fatty acid--CoA ligase [Kordiimonas marina]MCJ9430136.1 long-chain fatty acid--CoA ligase [Kordiimonas marina]
MFDMPDITRKRAALNPHKLAMEEVATGRTVTYAELDENAAKTAAYLAEKGVEAGDRVAVLSHNHIAFFELLFAVAKLGAVLVPLNWRMPPAELKPLITDSEPKLIFHDTATADTATTLPFSADTCISFDCLMTERAGLPPHAGRDVWPEDGLWYLLYTSGTTGQPKAVIQTFGMALANTINLGQPIDITSHDVTLNFLPLFHTAGINTHTMPVLMNGGTVMVMPGFDCDLLADLLESGRLTVFFGVPAVYQQLSLHPRFQALDLTRVRHWACGGAPISDTLLELFMGRGATICNGFGMTETGPTVFLMDRESAPEKIGSVGKPQLLVSVRMVGPDGVDVPAGETGELWISGPGITPGYWHKPKATAAALKDGWLKSGDLARVDGDGYHYIVGRSKDMYISGGENVYPAEVENVLATHEAILEAAVVGVPDARWGEVGHAFFMLRPEADAPTDEALNAFCRSLLAAYKVPKYFSVVAEFPRTAAGKIQKHLIERT